MNRGTAPDERDERMAAKILVALIWFTILVATASIFFYKLIEEALCNR